MAGRKNTTEHKNCQRSEKITEKCFVMILLNLENLVFIIPAILMFGPPIILTIAGAIKLKKNKKTAKTLFIIAAVYLIIGIGVCVNFLIELDNSMG